MTYQFELIDQNKFAKATLEAIFKQFLAHISNLTAKIIINLVRKALIGLLLIEKITIPTEYLNLVDVFSKNRGEVSPKQTKANKYAIELEEGKDQLYRSIYSLEVVEFESLKPYIKTNLLNDLFRPSTSLPNALIKFV